MNLVIHPHDPTTTFLKSIYEKVEDRTVADNGYTPDKLRRFIAKSDRILAMGHGSRNGLFGINLFSVNDRFYSFAISNRDIELLKGKDQNVYIWCYADQFVTENDLKGFYSGMFISEVHEAHFCGLRSITRKMVEESNKVFSEVVGEHINRSKEDIYDNVREAYGQLAKTNPVAAYNLMRLCVR